MEVLTKVPNMSPPKSQPKKEILLISRRKRIKEERK